MIIGGNILNQKCEVLMIPLNYTKATHIILLDIRKLILALSLILK